MKNAIRNTLAAAVIGILASACATSKPAADPSQPVELHGTKWKLVAMGGSLDGRVIAFKRAGKDGYIGTLDELGRRLSGVIGIEQGRDIFRIRRKGVNAYEGTYIDISPSGNISEREVSLFVNGDSFTWNQESAVWERMQ